MSTENRPPIETSETLFLGIEVYFSGSITGVKEADPNFAWELVQFMKQGGALVMSEHVAARTKDEVHEVRANNLNLTLQRLGSTNRITTEELKLIEGTRQNAILFREGDLLWLSMANRVVVLGNAPSFGVGMEVQQALIDEKPILWLTSANYVNNLSNMVRGVNPRYAPNFFLRTYSTLEEAKQITADFLLGKL